MDKRDGEKLRLRPDGKPFSLVISDVGDAVPAKISRHDEGVLAGGRHPHHR